MAFGPTTINLASGAVSDLFSIGAHKSKAEGSRIEAQQYDLAAVYARQNEAFSKTSTAIKDTQAQRNIYMGLGQQASEVAGAGFAAAGSALDLMRDSAAQGSLIRAVAGQQGLIEQAGYKQQAESYTLMAQAARLSAEASEDAASAAMWTGGLKAVAAVGSLFTPGV